MVPEGADVYVDDQAGLLELVDKLRAAEFVAFDTEFMRERTYFARLCLLQLATDDVEAIVDPLAIDDLTPLAEVLFDETIVKLVHAGQQDMEIFYFMFDRVPRPVFDTQLAATLAGFPQQVGYGALVHDLLGVTLDKSDTYTDWGKRPLSANQVEYALNDVRYLPEVYRRLQSDLERAGRLEWLAPDFEHLEDPRTYRVEPLQFWRRLKRLKSLNRRQLGVLQQVAAWRELEAQRRDIPRKWVLGDESLVEIARRMPESREQLSAVRGVQDKLSKGAHNHVIEAVRVGLALAEEELPLIERQPRLHNDTEGAADLMAALVRIRAKEHGVAVPLLAARKDLDRLAAGEREGNALLEGWRREMIGKELTDLLDGRIALSIENGTLTVRKLDGES